MNYGINNYFAYYLLGIFRDFFSKRALNHGHGVDVLHNESDGFIY